MKGWLYRDLAERLKSPLKAFAMIGLAVLGLAFLFFVVVAFFAAKTWQVGHVVAMSFLFLFTLTFLFLTATFLRTQQKFRPQYQKNITTLAQEQSRERKLRFGDGAQAADASTLIGAQTAARTEQFERGRVWRNVIRLQVPNQIVLGMARWRSDGCIALDGEEPESVPEPVEDPELAEEDVAAGDAEAGDEIAGDGGEELGGDAGAIAGAPGVRNPHGIVATQFLYGFKEVPIAALTKAEKEYYFGSLSDGEESFADGSAATRCRLPLAYVGQFRVLQADPQAVVVAPESPLGRAELQLINANTSWALYEKLPVDANGLFSDASDQLPQIIPAQRLANFGAPLPPPVYQAMLNDYKRDGGDANLRTDRPERVVVEVEFVKAYEIPVDLEVEGELPDAEQPFTADGRAQVRYLMQEEPTVKFEVGQTATFDAITATQLERQGFVKPIGSKYVRQLRDFEYTMKDLDSRYAMLRTEVVSVQKTQSDLESSKLRLQEQNDKLQQEMDLLNEDMRGFDAERRQLQVYRELLQKRAQFLQGEVERLSATSSPIATLADKR